MPAAASEAAHRRADATRADHQRAGAAHLQALALQAAHEALAVEHVADQVALRVALHRVAGAGHAHGGRHLVQQVEHAHLVRHGDEGAADVLQREQAAQHGAEVAGLAAHGNDDGVHPYRFEPGVVDHRRLEAVRRPADVGDELALPSIIAVPGLSSSRMGQARWRSRPARRSRPRCRRRRATARSDAGRARAHARWRCGTRSRAAPRP